VTVDPLTVGPWLKPIVEVLAAFWKNGALWLWCAATVCLVVLLTLFAGAYFHFGEAPAMLTAHGFDLVVGGLALIVCASFKTYAEREKPALSFVPNERQSFWRPAAQPDGRTQLALRYQVTNFSESSVMLSALRLYRPWVRRDRISYEMHMTKHPGLGVEVTPNSLTYEAATVLIERRVGRKGKPMRVVIGLQDNAGRWHKVVFPHVQNR
jgi:hypothetical protein